MMTNSIFLKKQGDSPKNRILDFLIVHKDFDYSLKDIARFSGVGYSTLKKMQRELIDGGWIILTRRVGKAKMYKLNLDNPVVDKFIDFYWSVVFSEIENKEEKKETYSSGPMALPVSAKNL